MKVVTREAAKIIHEEEYTSNPESNHPDILCGLNGNGVADGPRLNKPNLIPPIMNINHKPSGVDFRNSLKSFFNSLPINSPPFVFDTLNIPDQRKKRKFRSLKIFEALSYPRSIEEDNMEALNWADSESDLKMVHMRHLKGKDRDASPTNANDDLT
ncbi:hypothetical protein Tco_1129056 [Tanacetum coccineum]